MAIFHLAVKIVSRGKGQSSIAAASYRSGEKIRDEIENRIKDCRHDKGGVEYAEVLGFSGTREMLWNLAEKSEKRKDAQTAREIEVALPSELTLGQRIELVRDYAKNLIDKYGMACDISLHEPENKKEGGKNYHAHILTTVREVKEGGLGKKIESLNQFRGGEGLKHVREAWEYFVNTALEKANISGKVDCRSLEEQGIDRIATVHEGHRDSPGRGERQALNGQIRNVNMEKEGVGNESQAIRGEIGRAIEEQDGIELHEKMRERRIRKGIESEEERKRRAGVGIGGIAKGIGDCRRRISEGIGRIGEYGKRISENAVWTIRSVEEYIREKTGRIAEKIRGSFKGERMKAGIPEEKGAVRFLKPVPRTWKQVKAEMMNRDMQQREIRGSDGRVIAKSLWSREFREKMEKARMEAERREREERGRGISL